MQANNTFLGGNFAPVHEEVTQACMQIVGKFPRDLNGHFLRVGPNPQFAPLDEQRYHWFDGDGMIHQLSFTGGLVHYQNRWVRTKGFNLEREAGKSIWKGFQSLHELEVHHDMMTKNVANTALIWHANKLLALWEAGLPHSLTMPNLKTLGEETFEGAWNSAFTAHPVICPNTGEMITFGYNVIGEFGVTYGVFDAAGKLKHKANLRLKGKPVMIHDCAITPDYTVIMDLPVTFSLERALAGGAAFAWEPDNGARIGILPRYGHDEDMRWFEVKTGFIFHVFNAWQEGDEVLLEACRSNCSSVISDTQQYNREDEQAKPHQYRMNMRTGTCSERGFDDIACEFSRINEAYTGKRNQFAYAVRFSADSDAPRFDALIKFNRTHNSKQVYEFGAGIFAGEFVFAQRDNSQVEDDGYLLGFAQNEQTQQSILYVFDAQKIGQGPIAQVIMPVRVPYGFHGTYLANSQLAK